MSKQKKFRKALTTITEMIDTELPTSDYSVAAWASWQVLRACLRPHADDLTRLADEIDTGAPPPASAGEHADPGIAAVVFGVRARQKQRAERN